MKYAIHLGPADVMGDGPTLASTLRAKATSAAKRDRRVGSISSNISVTKHCESTLPDRIVKGCGTYG